MLLEGKPIQITNNFSSCNPSKTNSKVNSRKQSPTVSRVERRQKKEKRVFNQNFMFNKRKHEYSKIMNRLNKEEKGL